MFHIGLAKAQLEKPPSVLDGLTEASFTNIDLIMVLGALVLLGVVGAVTGMSLIL
jgi:hypothetical protein